MRLKKIIPLTLYASWSILGFKRGMDTYDFKYNKNHEKFNKKIYLYSDKMIYGVVGMFFYILPWFCLITIPKEIYRLEVNLRGIEDEKQTDYYKGL